MSHHSKLTPYSYQYSTFKLDSPKYSQEADYDEYTSDQQLSKEEQFYQCTQNQQKIWRLFNSLDCPQCHLMYNNKERRPQIICANNHLLCKSCYSKIRQCSLLCPFCHVRIGHKSQSSCHESIQLFLKIYNQIYEQQKCVIQEKGRKSPSCLQFRLPVNLRTLLFLMLIMVTPWIYDGVKIVVYWLVEVEWKVLGLVYSLVQEGMNVLRVIVEDEFYIGLYTNEKGDYVYYGQGMWQCLMNSAGNRTCQSYFVFSELATEKHRFKLAVYSKIINVVWYFYQPILSILITIYSAFRILSYTSHFIILVVGLIQFPFLIPLILIKLELFIPKKYIYRLGLYLDLVEPDYHDLEAFTQIEEDIQKLTKLELYFFLTIRNYMRYVLTIYRSVEVDMKKRCEDLQYKRKMKQSKKPQKEPQKTNKTINTQSANLSKSKIKFTFN